MDGHSHQRTSRVEDHSKALISSYKVHSTQFSCFQKNSNTKYKTLLKSEKIADERVAKGSQLMRGSPNKKELISEKQCHWSKDRRSGASKAVISTQDPQQSSFLIATSETGQNTCSELTEVKQQNFKMLWQTQMKEQTKQSQTLQ